MMRSGLLRACPLSVFAVLPVLGTFVRPEAVAQETATALAVYDTSAIETGDSLVVHIKVKAPARKPVLTDLSPWEAVLRRENILVHTDWERAEDGWQQTLAALFFEAGTLSLPALPILLESGDTLWLGPLPVKVVPTPVPEDDAGWRDLKGIWKEPATYFDRYGGWLWVILGMLVFAVVAYWLLRFARRRGAAGARVAARKLPHEVALERLKALENCRPWESGHVKDYYTELSKILREYLERRYGFPALESSTQEVWDYAAQTGIPAQLLSGLGELLRWCDWVKFARAEPPAYYHTQALREARRFVEQTHLAQTAARAHPDGESSG